MRTDSLATIFTISQCTADETERRRLIAISRGNLKKLHVTGCLFWTGRFFVHVLEGTGHQLGRALAAQCISGRQASPKVMRQARLETRQFGTAPLAYVEATDFDGAVAGVYEGSAGNQAERILLALLIGEYFEQLGEGGQPTPDTLETADAWDDA